MRKLLVLALTGALALLALIALPAAADAKPASGSFAGCYTIEKTGRYNDVAVGAAVVAKGKNLVVKGFVAVTKRCQKANSEPIKRITILHARLKDGRSGKVLRLSGSQTSYSKSIVRSTTGGKFASCGHPYVASVEVSYAYSDGSYVHPFWVHGRKFTRC